MTTDTLGANRSYDPNRLLDALKEMLKLDSDIALSQILEVPAPLIGQIRHRGYPVGPSILIRMHDVSTLSVQELREIMGDRRKKIRTSYDEAFLADGMPENRGNTEGASGSQRYLYLIIAALIIYVAWSLIL